MIIKKDRNFLKQLISIVRYISKDKRDAALNFETELNEKIHNIIDFPYKYRASHYFNDKSYRDLVYKGYTIIYKIMDNEIWILEIFKWIDNKGKK